jgi:aspartyl-tRNA(Asn)/glutamyl-tRNA(Gln) amidotransferase subunit B
MECGNFRIDANISLHRLETPLGTRVEIKNLNSFRFMQMALTYEAERHLNLLESGGSIVQETRLFDHHQGKTLTMRDKEDANDYRYFPDPDLPPLILTEERIEALRQSMPELPEAKTERYQSEFGLSSYDATLLVEDFAVGNYYEMAMAYPHFVNPTEAYKLVANWILGDLFATLKEKDLDIEHSPLAPQSLAELVALIQEEILSGKMAKSVFAKLWNEPTLQVRALVEKMGLKQISDETVLRSAIRDILENQEKMVQEYRKGKTSVFGFLVGQVMNHFKGQAHPEKVNRLIRQELEKDS